MPTEYTGLHTDKEIQECESKKQLELDLNSTTSNSAPTPPANTALFVDSNTNSTTSESDTTEDSSSTT